jgi:hypothetical protein
MFILSLTLFLLLLVRASMFYRNHRNSQSNEWVSFDMMFNDGVVNSTLCKCVSIMVRHNVEQSAYDMILADVQSSFALAPNVLVVRKSVSVNGGIFADSTDEIVDVPKTVSQDDVNGMWNMFCVCVCVCFACS